MMIITMGMLLMVLITIMVTTVMAMMMIMVMTIKLSGLIIAKVLLLSKSFMVAKGNVITVTLTILR